MLMMMNLVYHPDLTEPDIGHLNFLEKASKEGDYLIVGIHSDLV